jgi:hypothetical protein
MGGNSLMMKPLPPAAAEIGYSGILKGLNIDKLPADQRLHELLNAPI